MTTRLVQLAPISPEDLTYRLPAHVLSIFDGDVMLERECYTRFDPVGSPSFIKLRYTPAFEIRALVSDSEPTRQPETVESLLRDILDVLREQSEIAKAGMCAASMVQRRTAA